MTQSFVYGDIVRCVSDHATTTGPLKKGGLYVVEALALHGKSIRVAGDWHSSKRFEKVGTSNLGSEDPNATAYLTWKVDFESLDKARQGVDQAFLWSETDEGFAFWSNVYNRLDTYCVRFRPYAKGGANAKET